MNPSLRHVGIVVDDMENCVNFWRDIMKFRVLKELDEKGKNLDKMIGLLNITAKFEEVLANVMHALLYLTRLGVSF